MGVTPVRSQRGLSAATKLEDWIDYAIRSDCAPLSLAQFDNLAQKTRLSRLVVQSEFQVGPSEAIHSDPMALDPLGQLADVDLILLGRVSPLRDLCSTNDHNLRSLRKFWNPFSHAALSSCSVSACRAASNAVTLLRPTTVTW